MLDSPCTNRETEALGGRNYCFFYSFCATVSKHAALLLSSAFLPWFCVQSSGPQTSTPCWEGLMSPSMEIFPQLVSAQSRGSQGEVPAVEPLR